MNKNLGLGLLLASSGVFAQSNGLVFVAVPALDEVGIVGLIVLIGAVGGWIARRRK